LREVGLIASFVIGEAPRNTVRPGRAVLPAFVLATFVGASVPTACASDPCCEEQGSPFSDAGGSVGDWDGAAIEAGGVHDDGDVGQDGRGDEPGLAWSCPAEMAPVGSACVDRYEVSRQDATATSVGTDESVATSRVGVLPWYANPMTSTALAKFQAACQAAGKRLCSASEWLESCRGPSQTSYFFGNTWDPAVCNSVDTYCQQCCDILGLTSCSTSENCGYLPELSSSPYVSDTCFIGADYGTSTCHVCFHVMPTGAFSGCTNDLGLFDVNGNVWEAVPVPVSEDSRGYQIRGGAFNCATPSTRFVCTFNATWSVLNAGFRCCKDRGTP
jgi:hypothetical protein